MTWLYILAGGGAISAVRTAWKLFYALFIKDYGPSILSGPSPRYGFSTVGPKKRDEGK